MHSYTTLSLLLSKTREEKLKQIKQEYMPHHQELYTIWAHSKDKHIRLALAKKKDLDVHLLNLLIDDDDKEVRIEARRTKNEKLNQRNL